MTPVHPWSAPREDAERQRRPAAHDSARLAVNLPPDVPPNEPPLVQPPRFAWDR
ncbi:hypothetical protein [Streptomyces naganishii]|uniref:hypothetical protein n=1 Tax=Streptomyces naganishii TaxID=285447 RepID=UPI00167D3A5F|nr:hypothetical protein [Streptomyces naganishii]